MVDRRTALRFGAAATVGSALGVVGQRVGAPSWAGVGHRDWSALLRTLSPGATLFRQGQASYESLSLPFNHRYAAVRPAGILVPQTIEDISAAVVWARDQGIALTPRSSLGHNYAGYSTTTGLLVIMSRLRKVAVRAATTPLPTERFGSVEVTENAGLVTLQAGVINADMQPLLADDGLLVPAGRCPSVGIAGLVLGGGIGFSDKMFGVTCDRLVATTVVLADGSIVRCDESTNADLFWACRGGAGNNFGVNASFTFQYERVRGEVAFYQLAWGIDNAAAALTAFEDIAAQQVDNRRFDCRLGVGTSGLTEAEIRGNVRADAIGQFYGSAAELTRILDPVLRIGTPAEQQSNRDSIRELTPAESARLLSGTTPMQQFAVKSTLLADPLSEDQVHTVIEGLRHWPGSRNPDGASVALFGMGGRVNEVPRRATAFVHRDSLFVFACETAWADADPPGLGEANRDWLNALYRAVFAGDRPHEAYQNFPDPDLVDWRRSYYGVNYPRLVEVKRHYDPADFFTYQQGIGARD